MQPPVPFLMFEGRCEEALTFYAETFPDTTFRIVQRHGGDAGEAAGTVMPARGTITGMAFAANDSPMEHGFDFTPSISFWIDCDDSAARDRIAERIGARGRMLMPVRDYGFRTASA